MSEPFQGKAQRLTEEIYRVLRAEGRALTPYAIWKRIISSKRRGEPSPARTVVARRVSVLARRGFLSVARREVMPNGLVKKYYEATEKFRSAKHLQDVAKRTEMIKLLTDMIRFDEGVPEEAERLLRKVKGMVMKATSP